MKCLVFLAILAAVQADIYMDSPRGSNNRLDEARRDRNNGNRLFDSQNNNRGGYNVGGIYYYTGTQMTIEWKNQHSCSDPNNHCQLIVQYMCDSRMRDGSSTGTIPENPAQCENFDCNTDLEYGMHESFEYWQNCKYRERNMGLFTADRKLNGQTARFTRQNNGGTRRGYECAEERDYYPYWAPSPWKDIVIMTSNVTACPYYEAESQNVKSRFACEVPSPYYQYYRRCGKRYIIPSDREECESISWNYTRDARNSVCRKSITWDPTMTNKSLLLRGVWKEHPSHDLPPPDCREAPWSRDNHLGNGMGGHANTYNWTIPSYLQHEFCVLRMRYNISTNEYDAWSSSANWTLLNAPKPRPGQRTNIPIWEKLGLNKTEATRRDFIFRQNPTPKIYSDLDMSLRLAINTNQFGRTFQDRTHTFAVRQLPADHECSGRTIHNLQVRGKRGNIVQTYPGVEYDFVPNRLTVTRDDCIHFQWTGSNTNPNNNAGQGKQGTDRHNVVLLEAPRYPEGMQKVNTFGQWGLNYPAHLDNTTFLGFDRDTMDILALLHNSQFRGEMSELDDAGTYFDLGPKKVTRIGTYNYMCTRNNNFSNRSQKGKLSVVKQAMAYQTIGWNGGNLTVDAGRNELMVPRGTWNGVASMRMEKWSETDCQQLLETLGSSIFGEGKTASNCLAIYPQQQLATGDKKFTVKMELTDTSSTDKLRVYQTTTAAANSWAEVSIQASDDKSVTFEAQGGGLYVAKSEPNIPLYAGIGAACFVILIVILGTVVYFKKYPGKLDKMRTNASKSVQYAKRSFQSKV